MADMMIRLLRPEDASQAARWVADNKINDLDPDVIANPQTTTFVASDDEPVVYLPVQGVAMLDALGKNPKATKQRIAKALSVLIPVIAFQAATHGVKEIYLPSGDPETIEFAKAHGFEEVKLTFLRLKTDTIK